MIRSNFRPLHAVLAVLFGAGAAEAQVIWTNTSGSWHAGSNWVGGSTPGASDTAQIGGGNATVDTGTSINRLTLNDGNIGGTGSLTITGTGSTWSAGSMNRSGTTTVAATANLTISSGASHDLNGTPLVNAGTITWNAGYLRGGNGGTLTNNGTFADMNSSGYSVHNPGSGYGFGGSFRFVNNGTYVRDTTGSTSMEVPFDNNGVVDVRQGVMQFRAGGTMSGSATMAAAAGTTIEFADGFSLAAGAALTGAGSYVHSGGSMTLSGAVSVGKYTQTGGTLAGNQTLAGTFDWHGGTWNSSAAASTTVATGATLNLGNGANHDFNYRQITNQGTVNWDSGFIRAGNGSVFTNTGTFNDRNVSGYSIHNPGSGYGFGGTFTFVNSGTYVRNVGGTTYFDVPFDNTGTLDLKLGNIEFRGGGTQASTGKIIAASGTNVYFRTDYTMADGSALSGAGYYELTGGILSAPGTLKVATFNQTGGRLAGSHTLDGTFNWNGGDWNAAGASTTTVGTTGILNLGNGANHDFNYRSITNQGVVNWNSGYMRAGNGSVFTNSGTFNDLNGSSYSIHNPGSGYGFGGTFVFVNDGTYERNATGATAFDVPFNNNGILRLLQGSIEFRAGGTLSGTGTMDAAAGTNLYFRTDYTIANGSSLTGAGNYELSGGTLTVPGILSVTTFKQSGGGLAGTNTLQGIFNWHGGSWNATAPGSTTTVAATGVLNLGNGANHDFNYRGITNNGIVNWQSGYLRAGNGSVFTNAGTFNDLNGSSYSVHNPGSGYGFGGTFTFVNNGSYIRDAAGTTTFDVPFHNNQTIDVRQGNLQFNAGGILAGTGSIAAALDSNVYFTNGFSISDGASLTGAGAYWLTGGTLSITGVIGVGTFHQTGGTLAGSNMLNGVYSWDGGNWNDSASGNTTAIGATAILHLGNGANHDFNYRQVTNNGVVNWTTGYIRAGNGSVFTNNATFNDLNGSSYSIHNPGSGYGFGGTFRFVNNGNYIRNAAGTTYLDVPFDNNAVVDLRAGDLQFRAGGTLASAGSIAAAATTNVYFTSGYTIENGASLGGAGKYWLTDGILSLNGSINVGSFSQTGGRLAGNSVLHGTFDWNGGDWNASATSATTTIGSTATLNLGGGSNHDFVYRQITNNGIVNWASGYVRAGNGSVFTNAGTFNDLNVAGYSMYNPGSGYGFGGAFSFVNNGLYAKATAGTTTFDIPFTNSGGVVSVTGGLLRFAAAYTHASGSLVLSNSATARFDLGLAVSTGSLSGTGTVEGNVQSHALISPGTGTGTLAISGNLTLMSTSLLLFELGGSTQGVAVNGYDFLSLSGNGALGGALAVSFANGFQTTVSPTATFTVLTASGLTGAFANVANGARMLTSDGFGSFKVNYGLGSGFGANSVVLSEFVAVPEPSTWAMMAVGAMLVLLRVRRRS